MWWQYFWHRPLLHVGDGLSPKNSEIVSLIVKCGGCEGKVNPASFTFEVDIDDRSCPGCDGSGGQMTCLCGGGGCDKKLTFRCPDCKFYGTIYID